MEEQTKECTRCHEVKPVIRFSKDKQKKDGLRSNCKDCAKVDHKKAAQMQKEQRHVYYDTLFENIKKEDPEEEWRPIDGYDNYLVSSKARIFSKVRQGGGGLVKEYFNVNGYKVTSLTKNGKTKTKTLHRLLAKAFIQNPENLPSIDHIDRNRQNNNLSNLRWVSDSENSLNRFAKGCIYIDKRTINGTTYSYFRVSYRQCDRKRFKSREEAEAYLAEMKEKYP